MSSTKKPIMSTQRQIRTLVEKMYKNPDAARGKQHFGQAKQIQEAFWVALTDELNSLGPPLRSNHDWRRVWMNYKTNTRRTVARNRRNAPTTIRGALSEEVPLTALKETVFELLNTTDDSSDAPQILEIGPAAPVQTNKRRTADSITPSTNSSADHEDIAGQAPQSVTSTSSSRAQHVPAHQSIVPRTTTTIYGDRDETFCSYLKAEINRITNQIIKDELKETITLALFDAKKKLKRFSKGTSTTKTFSDFDQNSNEFISE